MREFGSFEKVVDDARHDGARPVFVEKGKGQRFHVAEKFSGVPGRYVPREETIRGFREIVDGKMDDYPEAAFFNVGGIDEVREKAEKLKEE